MILTFCKQRAAAGRSGCSATWRAPDDGGRLPDTAPDDRTREGYGLVQTVRHDVPVGHVRPSCGASTRPIDARRVTAYLTVCIRARRRLQDRMRGSK